MANVTIEVRQVGLGRLKKQVDKLNKLISNLNKDTDKKSRQDSAIEGINKQFNEVEKHVEKQMRKAAKAALTSVVELTPVDTGLAKGNWVTKVQSTKPNLSEKLGESNFDPTGAGVIADGLSVIQRKSIVPKKPAKGKTPAKAHKYKKIFITNSLNYIEDLDDGTASPGGSPQAPNGMSALAAQAGRRAIK